MLPTNQLERINQAFAGRYRVQRELGRDGFAVYLAHDVQHHRQVVLWVLRAELVATVGAERFLREMTAAAQLDHPHILPVLDSGQAQEFLYYVMPHVEGEWLRNRLWREKRLRVDDALQITRQVADALSYAHSHGVVHLDIKPEHIVLVGAHAQVDFGWHARPLTFGDEMSGVVIGTASYMSPERVAGAPDVDHRSDVYSLACVLYEMLTGDPPFTAPDTQTLFTKVFAEIPTPIHHLRPDLPAAVEAALGRALAKLPADRFATALQFAQALDPRHLRC